MAMNSFDAPVRPAFDSPIDEARHAMLSGIRAPIHHLTDSRGTAIHGQP